MPEIKIPAQFDPYIYSAFITKVYDGDGSFKALVDLGMGHTVKKSIRLNGLDTPEIRGRQKAAGKIVRNYVRSLILGQDVIIRTHKDRTGHYGRLLADIFIPLESHTHLSLGANLLDLKFAKPYDGGKKELWTTYELEDIINRPL